MKAIQFAVCTYQPPNAFTQKTGVVPYPWLDGIAVFGIPHTSKKKKEFLFVIDTDGIPHQRIENWRLRRKYGSVTLPIGK